MASMQSKPLGGRKGKGKASAFALVPNSDYLLSSSSSQPLMKIRGPVKPHTEIHIADIAKTVYDGSTTGTIALLNKVAVGSTVQGRLGNKILIKDVSLTGKIYMNPVAGAQPVNASKVRVFLFWDNAYNNSLPAITDILNASSSLSFVNINNSGRFTLLWSKSFAIGMANPVGGAGTATGADLVHVFETAVRINSVTQFMDVTSTAIQNGAVLMITVGDNVFNVNTTPLLDIATRVTFVDEL